MASQCAINNLDTIADTFHIDPKVTLCFFVTTELNLRLIRWSLLLQEITSL